MCPFTFGATCAFVSKNLILGEAVCGLSVSRIGGKKILANPKFSPALLAHLCRILGSDPSLRCGVWELAKWAAISKSFVGNGIFLHFGPVSFVFIVEGRMYATAMTLPHPCQFRADKGHISLEYMGLG
jgi:hypothetical protein